MMTIIFFFCGCGIGYLIRLLIEPDPCLVRAKGVVDTADYSQRNNSRLKQEDLNNLINCGHLKICVPDSNVSYYDHYFILSVSGKQLYKK